MELKNIEAFLMITEKGSFTLAAETLYITQPTISSRIQRLEQEIGTPLFGRNGGKGSVLTPFGVQIYPYFKEGYLRIQEGIVNLRDLIPQKKIRLSCPNYMGQFILPVILKALYQKFPEIEFTLKIGVTSSILEEVKDAKIDVGFIYLDEAQVERGVSLFPVTKEETALVCSPHHPLTKKRSLAVMDLIEERMIIYSKTFITTIIIDKFLKKNGLTNYDTMEIKNLEWMKIMIKNGLGIAFLQRNIVKEELNNQSLVELEMTQNLPTTPVSLLFRTSVPEDIKVVIIETAKSLFKTD